MKITELGILTHPGYKIAFVLDKTSMFSITTKRNGKPYKHEVKALDIIWNKFPELYSPVNSIHIDDLSRNFAMNPQSVCHPMSLRISNTVIFRDICPQHLHFLIGSKNYGIQKCPSNTTI